MYQEYHISAESVYAVAGDDVTPVVYKDIDSLGCYKDRESPRALSDFVIASTAMTVDVCIDKCMERGEITRYHAYKWDLHNYYVEPVAVFLKLEAIYQLLNGSHG